MRETVYENVSRGYGFVTFSSIAHAEKSVSALDNAVWRGGRRLQATHTHTHTHSAVSIDRERDACELSPADKKQIGLSGERARERERDDLARRRRKRRSRWLGRRISSECASSARRVRQSTDNI